MATHTSLSARVSSSNIVRYSVAFAAVLTALLACGVVNSLVEGRMVYVLLLPAVAFSGWYCGLGPSIVAVAVALIGAKYELLSPTHSFRIAHAGEFVGLLAFLLSSIILVAMAEARRRENETLRRAQGELEDRVQSRTVELDVANRNLRELSARLLQLQDDERRRIARELHDSVGQTLAALTMNLAAARTDLERLASTAIALADSESLVQEMSTEVRTISHLLHPPLLDEAGLLSAVRWYVDGFAQRSKIHVDLDLPDDFGRLSRELETAIFRVVQECLTNVHRHSGSPIAKIRFRRHDDEVSVEVEDRGKGIAPEKQDEMASHGMPGVGIRGMRERLRQLGGILEMNSNGSGTVVIARLPLGHAALLAPSPKTVAAA